MKRPIIILTVTDVATGQEVHREQRGAHNAGFHASESAVRAIARAEGQMYTGGTPEHIGGRFGSTGAGTERTWRGMTSGRVLRAKVVQTS